MSNENKSKMMLFLDPVGRTILGEDASEEGSKDTFKVKNPVLIIINGDKTGKMSVQLFPLFFREFLADKEQDVVLSYNKNNITFSNIEALDFRLQSQYTQMFNKNNMFVPPTPEAQSQPATGGDVINLFDE